MTEIVAGSREQIREVSTGRGDVYMVPVGSIRVREGFNAVREADPDYPAHIRELADSIKANGFMRHKTLTGLIASDGFVYLSDGHTRYAATLLANEEGAGIESLPFMNEAKGTNDDDRIFGLITNNSGKRLTQYGEALVIKQLIGRGIDEKEIARRLGFAVQKVTNLLELCAAPREVVQMVVSGEVSATTAVKVIKAEGANATAALEAGKAIAKAAGKTKVTAKHLKPAAPAKEPVKPALHGDTMRLEFMLDAYAAVRKCAAVGEQPEGFVVEDSQGAQLGWGVTLRGAIDNAISKHKAAA
jgi:ParB-like chromosome segregation protein Spo0J